jgi:hypothetical protein
MMKNQEAIYEIVNGIKEGTHWYTGQMTESEQEELAFIYNFKQMNYMTAIQVRNLMDDNGIVAFAGDMKNVESSVKVRGYPVFGSFIPLGQSVVDLIKSETIEEIK